MYPGQRLVASQCYYHVRMQGDGNLVLYAGPNASTPLWASDTAVFPGAYAAMQKDGNLVVYSKSGYAKWASHTERVRERPAGDAERRQPGSVQGHGRAVEHPYRARGALLAVPGRTPVRDDLPRGRLRPPGQGLPEHPHDRWRARLRHGVRGRRPLQCLHVRALRHPGPRPTPSATSRTRFRRRWPMPAVWSAASRSSRAPAISRGGMDGCAMAAGEHFARRRRAFAAGAQRPEHSEVLKILVLLGPFKLPSLPGVDSERGHFSFAWSKAEPWDRGKRDPGRVRGLGGRGGGAGGARDRRLQRARAGRAQGLESVRDQRGAGRRPQRGRRPDAARRHPRQRPPDAEHLRRRDA